MTHTARRPNRLIGPCAAALPAACILALVSVRAASPDNNPAIVTESGPAKGVVTAGMREYLGIPFAAAPAGSRRWAPPESFGPWHGVFEATAFGSQCPQNGGGDENCLFLNVYAPTGPRAPDGLPVMVWVHGGGLTSGDASEFDPTPLMSGGRVIVVTINYRLGTLGFLAHAALDAEGHPAGNYGFMDQQFALQWVQRNIEAFGGDRHRVTVFGESAGGLSVYSLLASPLTAGLFQGAIAQSGACAGFDDYRKSPIVGSVLVTYPLPPSPPVNAAELALGAVGTDGVFSCTARRAMQALAPFVTTFATSSTTRTRRRPSPR
jgi:para-nitrobenzyl esterase